MSPAEEGMPPPYPPAEPPSRLLSRLPVPMLWLSYPLRKPLTSWLPNPPAATWPLISRLANS